jgi:transposase
MVSPYTAFLIAGAGPGITQAAAVNMRSRNKQIALDILTDMSARQAGEKYNITHQTAGRILIRVTKEALKHTEYKQLPNKPSTVNSIKSMANRLIPIVHNHYKEI